MELAIGQMGNGKDGYCDTNDGQDYESSGLPQRRPISPGERKIVEREGKTAMRESTTQTEERKQSNKANHIPPTQQSRSTTSSAFSNPSVRPAVSGKPVPPTNHTNPFTFHVPRFVFAIFSYFHLFGFSSVTQFPPTPRGFSLPVPCEKKKTALFFFSVPALFLAMMMMEFR